MTDSTSQVARFSVVTFSDYSDWGEMITPYYAIVSPLFCKKELTTTLRYSQLALFFKTRATCAL